MNGPGRVIVDLVAVHHAGLPDWPREKVGKMAHSIGPVSLNGICHDCKY